jgi:hypothetical protein
MKPFNREKFLLYMLAGIFTWQAALFTFGVVKCFGAGGREACPNLGDRYENTVGIMVATTLALLGAGAVASQRKPSVSDPSSPLASSQEPVQSTVQRPVPELVPESVPESVRGKGKGRTSGKGS